MPPFGLLIHGGAGVLLRSEVPPALEQQCRAKLTEALEAGYTVLAAGGPALDAVVAAVRVLEDSPLFNAAHGAVLTADGLCELDAAIMDGRTRAAGSVAGVKHIRNPITLARDVMEKSHHVMLAGEGAERFAEHIGHTLVGNDYFQIERRRQQLRRAKEMEARASQNSSARVGFVTVDDNDDGPVDQLAAERKWGTVGCVALDQHGHLAAGTSTGGMTNKKFGRIGDSPVIGAGTYADDATCALSATGHGEFFIRSVVGHDVAAQMAYAKRTLADAASATIAKVGALGGTGGVIALDAQGNFTLHFNTPGMHRGVRMSTGVHAVMLYGDESAPR
ncbi:MAG TPA: isoaspartyl peptidase/L-asparaginase [Opitutaceae bacterium]